MFNNEFPYTDFHELNLDWILKTIKNFIEKFDKNLKETIVEKVNELLPEVIYNKENESITLKVINSTTNTVKSEAKVAQATANTAKTEAEKAKNSPNTNFVTNFNIGDDNIIIKDHQHDIIMDNLNKLSWGKDVIIFDSYESMILSNHIFMIDNHIITLKRNNENCICFYDVVENGENNILYSKLKNNLYAKYIKMNEVVNVLDFGCDKTGTIDISDKINFLLENVSKQLYFPSGSYYFCATIPKNSKIIGDGSKKTLFYPSEYSTENVFLKINGDGSIFRGFHIFAKTNSRNKIGFKTQTESDNNIFDDIIIENMLIAFSVTESMIWNTFKNVQFIGSFNKGFYMDVANKFFNNNNFYNCKFNDNVNEGLYISASGTYTFANNFMGCNIENNNQDRFNIAHSSSNGAVFNSVINLIGCYIENNNTCAIYNYSLLNLIACSFIIEKRVVNNENPSYTNFIGCKSYNVDSYVVDKNNNVSALGNSFTI